MQQRPTTPESIMQEQAAMMGDPGALGPDANAVLANFTPQDPEAQYKKEVEASTAAMDAAIRRYPDLAQAIVTSNKSFFEAAGEAMQRDQAKMAEQAQAQAQAAQTANPQAQLMQALDPAAPTNQAPRAALIPTGQSVLPPVGAARFQ